MKRDAFNVVAVSRAHEFKMEIEAHEEQNPD